MPRHFDPIPATDPHNASRTDRRGTEPGHPERGVPYSVSWFVDDRMVRVDRAYVLIEQDPLAYTLVDAITGQQHHVSSYAVPLFGRPTA